MLRNAAIDVCPSRYVPDHLISREKGPGLCIKPCVLIPETRLDSKKGQYQTEYAPLLRLI
jgi:hypothetical protein